MAMSPRNRTTVPQRPTVRMYYVYDSRATNLGDAAVKMGGENSEHRVVFLTHDNAKYWLEQMAIGDKPLHQQSESMRNMLHQVSGGHVEATDEYKEKMASREEAEQGQQNSAEQGQQKNKASAEKEHVVEQATHHDVRVQDRPRRDRGRE